MVSITEHVIYDDCVSWNNICVLRLTIMCPIQIIVCTFTLKNTNKSFENFVYDVSEFCVLCLRILCILT